MKCEVCNRELGAEVGNPNVFDIDFCHLTGPELASFRRVFPEIRKMSFKICWVCVLKGFGIKFKD